IGGLLGVFIGNTKAACQLAAAQWYARQCVETIAVCTVAGIQLGNMPRVVPQTAFEHVSVRVPVQLGRCKSAFAMAVFPMSAYAENITVAMIVIFQSAVTADKKLVAQVFGCIALVGSTENKTGKTDGGVVDECVGEKLRVFVVVHFIGIEQCCRVQQAGAKL